MATAVTPKPRTVSGHLLERAQGFAPLAGGSARVERGEGLITIRGVKVCSKESVNTHGTPGATKGTRYTEDAFRQELPQLEGVAVNLNHPPPDKRKPGQFDRPAEDRLGRLENARIFEGELYADLVMLAKHPMAEVIANAADSMPDAFALSHNARGDGPVVDGWWVIETIGAVKSVDVVADGGTNRSLFESGKTMKVMLRTILETRVLPALRAGRKRRLARLLETRRPALLLEAEDEPAADHRDHLHAAMKMCEDAGDVDMAKKIHGLMKPAEEDDEEDGEHMEEDEANAGTPDEQDEGGPNKGQRAEGEGDKEGETPRRSMTPKTPDDGGDPAKKVGPKAGMESRLRELEAKDACRTLCESMGFALERGEFGQIQLKALMGLSRAERVHLIKAWKDARGTAGLRSRSLIQEPRQTAGVYESDNAVPEKDEDQLNWLRN